MTTPADDVTVLVTVSPVPSHPSTQMVQDCIASARTRLPGVAVIVMADGVRTDLQERRVQYADHLERLRAIAADDDRMELVEWAEWQHQARMVRHALADLVTTPLVILAEHDTTLAGDIDFDSLVNVMHSGEAKCVRFHHEARVLPEHEHLSIRGSEVEMVQGVPLIATAQYSARPHLADADWYRWLLGPRFMHPESVSFIEDAVWGRIVADWHDEGTAGWERHRLWIYAEEDENGSIVHSRTCDGRQDDPKAGLELLPLEDVT